MKTYKKNDIWDYQWFFTQTANDGLCIIPSKNLVNNIGTGLGATHDFTGDNYFDFMNLAGTHSIDVIKHPPEVTVNEYFINLCLKKVGIRTPCEIFINRLKLLFTNPAKFKNKLVQKLRGRNKTSYS